MKTFNVADGEVVGLDNDGCIICWDAINKEKYNTGVSLTDFGLENLTEAEQIRICIPNRIRNLKTFNVNVYRTAYSSMTIQVQAEDEVDAQSIAILKAPNLEFPNANSADYDIGGSTEM